MPDDPQFPEPEAAWIGVEDLPLEFANTFSASLARTRCLSTLGRRFRPPLKPRKTWRICVSSRSGLLPGLRWLPEVLTI